VEKGCLWGINRTKFRNTIEKMVRSKFEENREFIENIPFFQAFTSDQKDSIASILMTFSYIRGDEIVKEGEEGQSLYIIKSGKVKVTKSS